MIHPLTIEETWAPRYSSPDRVTANRGDDEPPSPAPPDDEIAAAFKRLSRTMSWSS